MNVRTDCSYVLALRGHKQVANETWCRTFDASLMLDLIPFAIGPEARPTDQNDCRLVVVVERVPGS
jgi:hypothetical protein